MVQIEYRHYKKGDDQQLAHLFNIAFQQNGAGFSRTEEIWNWRYVQSPSFEPEMCHLAVDIDNNKIVGAVYSNLIEKRKIKGKEYLIGEINDVSCHPAYGKRGIATNLMNMAINYMEKKGVDFSMLAADYNGFPRKKIYLKLGYKDIERERAFIQCANIAYLIRQFPLLLPVLPILFIMTFIPRLLNRIRIRNTSFFDDVKYGIYHSEKHKEYRKAVNHLMSQQFSGFRKYSEEKFQWARVKVPESRKKPSYIFITKDGKIIGGSAITIARIYSKEFKFNISMGLIHEIFLDEKIFKNRRNLHLGYIYLLDRILKAISQRKGSLMFYQAPEKIKPLHWAFNSLLFVKVMGAAVMIRKMKNNVAWPNPKKPIYLPTSVSTGVP